MYICSCHLSQSWKHNNQLLRAFNTRYTTDNNLGKERSVDVVMIEKRRKNTKPKIRTEIRMHK
jgi:hypothetical protein